MKKLGASTDDPQALIERAVREAKTAIKNKDSVGLRQAAEKGWLAASATADVVAAGMGRKIPGGATGRRQTLEVLERSRGLKRGSLVSRFDTAKEMLHGKCFHADECPRTDTLLVYLEDIKNMSDVALAALRKRSRRR